MLGRSKDKHDTIIDTLIRERAQTLSQSKAWPAYRFFLYRLLDYKKAVQLVDKAGDWPAHKAFQHLSSLLNLDVKTTGIENIPKTGAFILAINHPSGIADGIALYDAIHPARPDMTFFANRDVLRLNEKLSDLIIPVEWVEEKKSRARTRETLVATAKAFKADKAIMLFPSGRLAFMDHGRSLTERPWINSVAVMAKKYQAPIIPAFLESRNSWLYYWLAGLHTELRDITLFHELLNKKGQTFRLTIGPPILPHELAEDNNLAAADLRNYVVNDLSQGRGFGSSKTP